MLLRDTDTLRGLKAAIPSLKKAASRWFLRSRGMKIYTENNNIILIISLGAPKLHGRLESSF